MTEKVIRQGDRFIVVDSETGEILDDAQGYGYTTAQKAYKGFYYKKNHKQIEEKMRELGKVIEGWLSTNPSFAKDFDQCTFMVLKEGDESYVEDLFKEYNPPFTRKEYIKYTDFKWKTRKRKKRKK